MITNLKSLNCYITQFVLCIFHHRADRGGIDTTLKIANTHSDQRLSTTATNLLSVQINYPESVPKLIEAGVFTFLASLFENQASSDERQPEVCISGLRCARRLLINKPSADVFVNSGGTQAVIHLMASCPDSAMVQVDSYKILLALINLFPPPPPVKSTAGDADWDAPVEDEGVLGFVYHMQRPPSPRSWETLGLTAYDIKRLIIAICACLGGEGHGKQLKLQRCGLGLLAYFACEKVPGTVDGFHEGQYHLVAKLALNNITGDYNIVKTVSRKSEVPRECPNLGYSFVE